MQVKETITNPELVSFVRGTIVEGFREWQKEHSSEAKKLGDYVKTMAKIRNNAQKEKKHVLKENFAIGFNKDKPKGWSGKCTLYGQKDENGNPYPTELIIVEGDSAGGTAKQARNKLFQEIYKLRGVPMNTIPSVNTLDALKKALDKLLENEEFKGLRMLMGSGSSLNPDFSKAPYDKYIVMSDADERLSA